MNEYTNKDALSPDASGERRDFRLKISSVTISLSAFSGDGAAADGESMPVTARYGAKPSVETDRVESTTLASITARDGRVTLAYDDAIDDAELPVPTKLSFAEDEPGLVTLERSGFMRSLMVFEAGKRHRATYRTPLGGFEMTVFSRTVENALSADGGTLTLDYAVEFRGAAEQKVKLTLEAARLER